LTLDREIGDRRGEAIDLGNLGRAYADLGETRKAIDFYEQALTLDREFGDRMGEAIDLEDIGYAFFNFEEYEKASENYQKAILFADQISFPKTQQNARLRLAESYLIQNDLSNARDTVEPALQFDVAQNNHNATALHGIIALRQGDVSAARQAFTRAVAQADEILAKTPEYYSALDAKGLALCGLALCADDGQLTIDRGKTIAEAVETFRKARKIAPHAGVVRSVLRLFDELVKCDEERILKDMRKVVEGQ
jgi:tetratricopeptide (TPR) repeat protein